MDGSPEATAPLQDGQADRVGYPAGPESRYASDSESGGDPLSPESEVVSGIVFITVPTIAFGGTALLGFIRRASRVTWTIQFGRRSSGQATPTPECS
jgi:hypothetical protein